MDLLRLLFRIQVFPILVIGLASTKYSQAYFELSKASYEWVQANTDCTPAAPNISFSTTEYKVEDIGINITKDEEFWVGYFQVVRVFEYIGCVSQNELLNSLPPLDAVEINGNPEHCFPTCQESTIVAVTKTRCYCLRTEWTTEMNIKKTRCTSQCSYPKVACGLDDNDRYSYLSVYKINPKVDHRSIGNMKTSASDMNCLCLDPSSKVYYWDACVRAYLIMCYNGNSIVTVTKSIRDSDFSSWIDAANTCFGYSYLPTNYSNSLRIDKHGGSQLWTGCFKTRVIYEHNAKISDSLQNDQKQYGYISKNTDEEMVVKFSGHDSPKRVLCLKGNYGKTSRLTTTETRDVTSSTDSDEKESRVYIPIGTSAAAVVTIGAIVVVLIVFVKRRRKKIKNECKRNDDVTQQDAENKDSCPALTVPDSTENSYYYLILQSRIRNEGSRKLPGDTTDSNIYNETALDKKREQMTENVYNHLDNGNDNTYDHALEHRVINMLDSNNTCMDDIYDSTVAEETPKAFVHTDNIYNKTDDSAENVYNCLTGNHIKAATDNIYGLRNKEV